MRKIEFRVWDGNLMHDVSELHFCMGPKLDGNGLKFYGPGVGEGWIDGESVHLMQYTGLKDAYGKKIFEGDIVYQEFHDRLEKTHGFIGVVKQEEGAWWIDNEINQGERLWSEVNLNHIKGNIFENPELLKKQIK